MAITKTTLPSETRNTNAVSMSLLKIAVNLIALCLACVSVFGQTLASGTVQQFAIEHRTELKVLNAARREKDVEQPSLEHVLSNFSNNSGSAAVGEYELQVRENLLGTNGTGVQITSQKVTISITNSPAEPGK